MPLARILLMCLIGAGFPNLATAQGLGPGPIDDYDALRAAKVYEARRTSERIVVDGIVDEPAWGRAVADDDFYQNDPVRGTPPDDRTVLRILYDDVNLYVGIVCYQAGPAIISELRRDFEPFDGAGSRMSRRFGAYSDGNATATTERRGRQTSRSPLPMGDRRRHQSR